jgi:hypothetical protein
MIVAATLSFDLELVKPNVAAPQSDKYSRYIYNWFKRNHKRFGFGIWCQQEIGGVVTPFEYTHAGRQDVYTGFTDDGCLNAIRIQRIQQGNRQPYAEAVTARTIEITDWFWEQYLLRGRCLMDADHNGSLMNDSERFTTSGETRVCNWCGMHQKLLHEQKVVHYDSWVNEGGGQ